MKRAFIIIAMTVFIALGIVFAVFYGNKFFIKHTDVMLHLFVSIVAALETAVTSAALILYIIEKKGRWVNVLYVLSGVLCVPLLLPAMLWALHFIGIDFLPPPQR